MSKSFTFEGHSNSREMPLIALGTFGKSDEIATKVPQCVTWDIEAGYRHIDTAQSYMYEKEIGTAITNAIARGIVKGEDLFITTRLNFGYNGSMVLSALNESLNLLQLDYVDLYQIHLPTNLRALEEYDIVDTWNGMEGVKRMGLAKSIGVSNFNSSQINRLLTYNKIRPAVNQIEVNPTFSNLDLVAYCQKEGIVVQSYAPMGFLVPRPFRDDIPPPPAIDDPNLTRVSKKYEKSVFQIYYMRYLVGISAKDQPKILLNDGNKMPIIALGTFGRVKDIDTKVSQAVIWAIEAGYRHFDTAASYLNEEEVGKAIKNVTARGIVKREDLFITTKLNFGYNGSMVPSALNTSLNKLQLDYVDLYLIHVPHNRTTLEEYDLVDTWKGMEEVKRLGLAKSIGVSNFNSSHINRLLTHNKIRPAVNQVEVNPTHVNLALVAYCQKEGITITSYAPMGFLVPRPFRNNIPPPTIDDPILTSMATKYGKTVHQILIRYLLDRGTVPIPKSATKKHIEENINVFDFSLSKEDIYVLNEFNLNMKVYDYSVEIANDLITYFYGH